MSRRKTTFKNKKTVHTFHTTEQFKQIEKIDEKPENPILTEVTLAETVKTTGQLSQENNLEPKDKIVYLVQMDTRIHENIKFADEKARYIITLNTAIIGVLYSLKFPILNFVLSWNSWQSLLDVFPLIVFLLLLAGTLLCIWVIFPKGIFHHSRSLYGSFSMPERIAPKLERFVSNPSTIKKNRIKRGRRFFKRFILADANKIIKNLLSLLYVRSKVNNKKYEALSWGIAISAFGWIAAILLLVFKDINLIKTLSSF